MHKTNKKLKPVDKIWYKYTFYIKFLPIKTIKEKCSNIYIVLTTVFQKKFLV